jgi:hypothetical protein
VQVNDPNMEGKGLLSSAWWSDSKDPIEKDKGQLKTLVLYIFSNTDPEYIDNLRFYVRNGIQEDDGCHHVIVINSGENSPVRPNTLSLSSPLCLFVGFICCSVGVLSEKVGFAQLEFFL